MDQEDHSSYNEAKTRGTKAALRLLKRKPDAAYLVNWTELLARPKVVLEKRGASVILFRLNKDWLAIDSTVFKEVISFKTIHRIPHRNNDILLGLVNYQGMLRLCVDMHNFLNIEHEKSSESSKQHEKFQRMVAIQKDNELWIFAVDEVQGVFHADINNLQNPPVTIYKSKASYLRGMIDWDGKTIGYIDEELLFFGLRRSLL